MCGSFCGAERVGGRIKDNWESDILIVSCLGWLTLKGGLKVRSRGICRDFVETFDGALIEEKRSLKGNSNQIRSGSLSPP